MKGLNKVCLIGHLGKDPEIRKLEGENQVAHVSVATTDGYRDANGKLVTHTDWHALILWGKFATTAEKHMRKGSLVYVEGKLKSRSYNDKLGHKKYVTEVIVDHILLLK